MEMECKQTNLTKEQREIMDLQVKLGKLLKRVGDLETENFLLTNQNEQLSQQNNQLEQEKAYWMDSYISIHNQVKICCKDCNKKDYLTPSTNASLEDLELTDKFLNKTIDLGYDVDEMEKAYLEKEKNYKF